MTIKHFQIAAAAFIMAGFYADAKAETFDLRTVVNPVSIEVTATTPMRALDIADTRSDWTTVIKEPKGTPVDYAETVAGFLNNNGKPVHDKSAYPNTIWFDGDDVYMQNPVASSKFKAYIKGKKTDRGIEVLLPQYLGKYTQSGKTVDLYLNVLELYVVDKWYFNKAQDTTITYVLDEDGSYTLEIPGNGIEPITGLPEYMLGIAYDLDSVSEYSWSYYGDYYEKYEIFEETPISLPEGLATEPWEMYFGNNARIVNVAVNDNEIYIGNWLDELSDSYVKGTVVDGIATFPITFLGESKEYGMYAWFTPSTHEFGYDEQWGEQYHIYYVNNEIKFKYNERAGTLSPLETYASVYLTGPAEVGDKMPPYIKYFFEPYISWQDPDKANANPRNPKICAINEYMKYIGRDIVELELPYINTKGAVLDTRNMYYVFYLDGEPFTFTPEVYQSFSEPMTEIPYDFVDKVKYNIEPTAGKHYISLYTTDYKTLGVQTFYNGTDGVLYKSKLIEGYASEYREENYGSVESICSKEIESVEYTDLSGVRVTDPRNGLYIVTMRFTDGTTKVTKSLR